MNDLHKLKWLPCGAGALLCLLGLGCLIWPKALSSALSVLIGVCMLALGLGLCALGLARRRIWPGSGIVLVQGVGSLAVGLVFLLDRDVSIAFVGCLLGLWIVAIGVLRARSALLARRAGAPWKGDAILAVLRLLCGVLVVARPFRGVEAGVMLLGAAMIFVGGSVIAGAWAVDRILGHSDSLDEWIDDSFGPQP